MTARNATRIVRNGWDGASRTIKEQHADCGCSWTLNGTYRLGACLDAIRGTCSATPVTEIFPEYRGGNDPGPVPAEYRDLAEVGRQLDARHGIDNTGTVTFAADLGTIHLSDDGDPGIVSDGFTPFDLAHQYGPTVDPHADARDLIATVQADNPRPAEFITPLPGTQAWRDRYLYPEG